MTPIDDSAFVRVRFPESPGLNYYEMQMRLAKVLDLIVLGGAAPPDARTQFSDEAVQALIREEAQTIGVVRLSYNPVSGNYYIDLRRRHRAIRLGQAVPGLAKRSCRDQDHDCARKS